MTDIKIPAFCEVDYTENRENENNVVWTIKNASDGSFSSYVDFFVNNGFQKREVSANEKNLFTALEKENCGVFINYFGNTGELRIVCEENCAYFSFEDNALKCIVKPQITQISLEDFGLSYAIRLSDGRFIVIDGGWNFEPDVDRLFECLKSESPLDKPIISAWILSHPHHDHFHCFIGFMDKYGDDVTLEKCMLNFPDLTNEVHYKRLTAKNDILGDLYDYLPMMFDRIEKSGAKGFTAHTGQKYKISDAELEILSSIDDTIHLTDNLKSTSLIIKMMLGGQTILWTNDAAFSHARLTERYGEYLKSDILQIPHHGFQSGSAEAEIEGYDLIRPRVCLLPVSDYCA